MFLGLSYYFILMDLFLYSFFGWIWESTYVSLKEHKLVNRGFLIGPILPLYGFGGTLVYVFLRPLSSYGSLLFAGGMLLATVIEFFTSWAMEKLFHAQWWDYSAEPYNFQGRVALIPSMFWGFLSLAAFDFLQPAMSAIIHAIPYRIGVILLSTAITLTAVDLIYTVFTTISFSKQLENLYQLHHEFILQLEEGGYTSLRELLTTRTISLTERAEAFRQHLNELKASRLENDPRLAHIDTRFHEYIQKHRSFQKKNHFLGNGRLVQAFPTMKFIPKHNKIRSKKLHSFRVKDFMIQLDSKSKENKKKD